MKLEELDIRKMAFNIREDKTIYLGIPTNILCINDRLHINLLDFSKLSNDNLTEQIMHKITKIEINDFTATLYLGKIIFKKNKYGNLTPIYIPSTITESSFEGLNTFWLNEINPNAKKPLKSIIQCKPYEEGDMGWTPDTYEREDKNIPYQKIHYYRTKDNIVLNKDQIISYFSELHKLNTTFIKNYIDSINNNNGIRANILHNTLYDELLEKGILHKDMFKWYSNGQKKAFAKTKLIALDYLKTINHSNFTIVFFDELFYAYLVWSLREYLLSYFIGKYEEDNQLLFNAGAYKKYQHIIKKAESSHIKRFEIVNPYYSDEFKDFHQTEFFSKNLNVLFYPNIVPTQYGVGYIEGYEMLDKRYGSAFSPDSVMFKILDIPKDYQLPKSLGKEAFESLLNDKRIKVLFELPKSVGYQYPLSPNENAYVIYTQEIPMHYFDVIKLTELEQKKLLDSYPSPLGNYYFELTDNRGTFIEYYQRIYPSIKNPPKGWNKEMMKKLELKLK